MKRKNIATVVNTLAIILLLTASLIYHVTQAFAAKAEGTAIKEVTVCKAKTGRDTIPATFPLPLFAHISINPPKPI